MTPTVWSLALASALVVTVRPRRPTRRPPSRASAEASHTSQAERAESPSDASTPDDCGSARSSRRSDDAAEVARWCEALSRVVRGGGSVVVALREVDPPAGHAPSVVHAIREIERTGRLLVRRRDASPHMTLALAVVSAAVEHGGPAAEPLDRAAAVLRARSAEHAERQVQSAQARLSAKVMSLLPPATLILLVGTSASVRSVVTSPAGLASVTAGVALNLTGWCWMRGIIERAAR